MMTNVLCFIECVTVQLCFLVVEVGGGGGDVVSSSHLHHLLPSHPLPLPIPPDSHFESRAYALLWAYLHDHDHNPISPAKLSRVFFFFFRAQLLCGYDELALLLRFSPLAMRLGLRLSVVSGLVSPDRGNLGF